MSNVKIEEQTPRFDELRKALDDMESKMWGVVCKRFLDGKEKLDHVEFVVRVESDEEHIVSRLYREKRVGKVEKIDDNTYRFEADVYDASELVPWIRTFICRIEKINFSDKVLQNSFKQDIEQMYAIYGIGNEEE